MRRAKCRISEYEAMVRILDSVNIGRMATIDEAGYPYITPVNFVFHEGAVYFHCSPKGEKLDNLSRNPKVGFEVDLPLAYLDVGFNPERNPCNTHQFYKSVVIRGQARIVPDGPLKTSALQALVAKHEGHEDFRPIDPEAPDYQACRVVEIRPEHMTAKADLAQSGSDPNKPRAVAEHLAARGWDGDREAVEALGFELEPDPAGGWKIK